MSLPAGFGINTGRAQTQGASSSKQPNKVSVSQPALRRSPLQKKDQEKRKPKDVLVQTSKKHKSLETPTGFPYDAPVTPAGDWFGKVADGYIEPRQWDLWNKRNREQAADACRRAAGELFFHLTCNPTDTEKLRVSLDAATEDKKKLKLQLDVVEKEKSSLEEFKTKAEQDFSRLRKETEDLRVNLNSTAQDLTAASERVVSLENTVADLQKQLVEANNKSFSAGFRSFVTGFLAVDPDYDWNKFIPATKTWVDQFRVEEAKAIEEKRLEIELEVAAASANEFLEQSSPSKARPDGDVTDEVLQLEQGANTEVQLNAQASEATLSQQGNTDSSQDQI